MARIAVWILLVAALAGYARSQTTGVTGTSGPTGTAGDMTTAKTTKNTGTPTGTPTTKPTEPKSTTKIVTTPEPEIPTFKTTDGQGKFCMIIALNARVFTDEEGEEQKSSVVPVDASVDRSPSECPQDEKEAYIELSWAAEDIDWVLGLYFVVEDDTYTMKMANGSYIENGTMIEWSSESPENFDFPDVDLGHSIHCKNFKIQSILHFEEYKFQPFAQRSNGNFGEAEECNEDEGGLDTVWIIVISCAGGVLLLLVLAGVCAYCSKRKQSSYDKV